MTVLVPPGAFKILSTVAVISFIVVSVTCREAHASLWRRQTIPCRTAVAGDAQSVVVTGVCDLKAVVQCVGPVAGVKRLQVDVQPYRTAGGETRQFGETEPVVASEVTKASLVVRPVPALL